MIKFQYTGNPFVDTGLAVMVARAKELELPVKQVSDLTPELVESITKSPLVKGGKKYSWLTETNLRLNSYTMIFSSNNPLTNASNNPELVFESRRKKIEKLKTEIEEENKKISNTLELINNINEINEISSKELERLKKNQSKIEEKIEKKKVNLKKIEGKIEKDKNKSINNSTGRELYLNIVDGLLDGINKKDGDFLCEVTGAYYETDLMNKNDQSIGKQWFPLVGTISDAQTLPASSRAVKLSAISLLTAQFVPMGVAILGGKLVCFQSNDYMLSEHASPLFQDVIEEIYRETMKKVRLSDKVETWGKNNPSGSVTLLLLNYLTRLYQDKQEKNLPEYICFNLWRFSNSGQDPWLNIIEIPNKALQFLWEAWRGNYKRELERYLRLESEIENSLKKKKEYKGKIISFLECITKKQLYPPFYSNAEISISVKFETLPNNFVLIIPQTLKNKISSKNFQALEKGETKFELQKNVTITEQEYMALLDISGEKEYQDVIKELYVKSEYARKKWASIGLFDLYAQKILEFSDTILSLAKWLVLNLKEHFKNDKDSEELTDYKINEFLVELAAINFTLEDYLLLFPSAVSKNINDILHPLKRDYNNPIYSIIRFYYRHPDLEKQSKTIVKDMSKYAHPKYPLIKKFAKDYFDYYIGKEGKDRFDKRILKAFSLEQIKPYHIEDWFCILAEAQYEGYSNEEWDDLCRDENGASDVREVMFQLRLELANLYHHKYNSNN